MGNGDWLLHPLYPQHGPHDDEHKKTYVPLFLNGFVVLGAVYLDQIRNREQADRRFELSFYSFLFACPKGPHNIEFSCAAESDPQQQNEFCEEWGGIATSVTIDI
jgi:hypothetical protein